MKKRPISPHLSIYSFIITMASSIFGRVAGAYLYVITAFTLLFTAFKIHQEKDVGSVLSFVISFYDINAFTFVLTVLFCFATLFCFFFYLLAVLRHLIWDFGFLLALKPSKIMGYGMFVLSFFAAITITFYMFFV